MEFSCPEHGTQAIAAIVFGYIKLHHSPGEEVEWTNTGDFASTDEKVEVICDICGELLGELDQIYYE